MKNLLFTLFSLILLIGCSEDEGDLMEYADSNQLKSCSVYKKENINGDIEEIGTKTKEFKYNKYGDLIFNGNYKKGYGGTGHISYSYQYDEQKRVIEKETFKGDAYAKKLFYYDEIESIKRVVDYFARGVKADTVKYHYNPQKELIKEVRISGFLKRITYENEYSYSNGNISKLKVSFYDIADSKYHLYIKDYTHDTFNNILTEKRYKAGEENVYRDVHSFYEYDNQNRPIQFRQTVHNESDPNGSTLFNYEIEYAADTLISPIEYCLYSGSLDPTFGYMDAILEFNTPISKITYLDRNGNPEYVEEFKYEFFKENELN